MQDIWGCDSSSGMQLTVYYSAKTEVRDTFCFGQTYNWSVLTIGNSSNLHTQDFSFIDSLATVDGRDGRDYNGRPCVQGNYVWKLIYSAVDYPGVLRSEIGSVLLLR